MTPQTQSDTAQPSARPAEIVREFGPFAAGGQVHGVSYDGERV